MRRSFIALFALFTVAFLLMPQILSYAEEDADVIGTISGVTSMEAIPALDYSDSNPYKG